MENNGLDPKAWFAKLPAIPQQSMQALEPMVKAATQGQAEMASLFSRRMRAWMDVGAQGAACRSPQDLSSLQVRFMQSAFQDYVSASRGIAEAWAPVWGGLMQMSHFDAGAGWWGSTDLGRAAAARDYIAVSEPQREPASDPRRPGERRAA